MFNKFKKGFKEVVYSLVGKTPDLNIPRQLALNLSSTPEQQSTKVTPSVERVDPQELEQAYISDAISFNSINKSTQLIMAAGHELITDKKSQNKYQDFFDNIGDIGDDMTSEELKESIFRYEMIYGNAYVELIFDRATKKRIVDLALLDSKRMDYAKTADGQIVLDKFGKAVGYTLKFPYNYAVAGQGDTIPKMYENKISLSENEIFLVAARICHFKLYTYGDRFYGLGLIEPAYKSVLRKMNIEEAQTNSIYARGTYPVIATVGDAEHEPTPTDIEETLKNLVKLKHDRYMAFPHWIKVNPLEVRQSDIVQSTLNYLRRNQIAALGMPEALAAGSGEATNRATLNNQQQILEFTLNDIVNKTVATFEKCILRKIALANGWGKAKIKWGDIGAEEINEKSDRLNKYVKNGILAHEDVTAFAKKSEGLDE